MSITSRISSKISTKKSFIGSLKHQSSLRLLLMAALGIGILLISSGCVSKDAYQQAVNKNANLNNELANQRQHIAQLQASKQTLEQQLTTSATNNQTLQQKNIEAIADIERQESIYTAKSVAAQQQLNQFKQQQDVLELDQRREKKRYQQLEIVSNKRLSTITTLQDNLEKERIARKARMAKMSSTYNKLVASLENEIHRGEVTITKLKNRLTVNLVEKILFASGSAALSSSGENVISQVGEVLKDINDKDIRVEGHSDNQKMRQHAQQRYPSNWELSAARAAQVVRFLQTNVGIAGEKLAISAYGSYRPVADNATAEGRSQNRRIQIILVPIGQ
ncbi:MAG: OmpA family protein [Thermodesulfobacteriota bacterium]|nr:OmpA family protein [Thermodesulfobacteriota bacterium]